MGICTKGEKDKAYGIGSLERGVKVNHIGHLLMKFGLMLMRVGHTEVKEEKLKEGHAINLQPFRNMDLNFMVLEFYKLKKYITNNSRFITSSSTWHFLIKIIQVSECHHGNFYGTRVFKMQ